MYAQCRSPTAEDAIAPEHAVDGLCPHGRGGGGTPLGHSTRVMAARGRSSGLRRWQTPVQPPLLGPAPHAAHAKHTPPAFSVHCTCLGPPCLGPPCRTRAAARIAVRLDTGRRWVPRRHAACCLQVDLLNTKRIMESAPGREVLERGIPMIGESGIFTPEHVAVVQDAGCKGILVGESIVKQGDQDAAVRTLLSRA